jgi:C1A family cysteine protease
LQEVFGDLSGETRSGETRAMMRTIAGKKRNLAWHPDRPDPRDFTYRGPIPTKPLPSLVDLRAMCPPIEEQGGIGSCSSHAGTSAMEYLYRKTNAAQSIAFSRLFVYYYTRVFVDQLSAAEDRGVSLRSVMKTLRTFGVCLEKTWPYDETRFGTVPPSEAVVEAFQHRLVQYFSVDGLLGFKACLAEGYPVVGGFSVPENVMSEACTKSGVIQFPRKEAMLGGHAVLFVGYDDAKAQLLFQNSWGTQWGDAGYGYLPYEFMNADLLKDLWTLRQST